MAVGQSISMVDSQQRVTRQHRLHVEFRAAAHAPCAACCAVPMRTRALSKSMPRRRQKLPGVAAVLTREDLIGDHIDPYFGLIIQDQTPVALDRVRFVGEPVAAVGRRRRRHGGGSARAHRC